MKSASFTQKNMEKHCTTNGYPYLGILLPGS